MNNVLSGVPQYFEQSSSFLISSLCVWRNIERSRRYLLGHCLTFGCVYVMHARSRERERERFVLLAPPNITLLTSSKPLLPCAYIRLLPNTRQADIAARSRKKRGSVFGGKKWEFVCRVSSFKVGLGLGLREGGKEFGFFVSLLRRLLFSRTREGGIIVAFMAANKSRFTPDRGRLGGFAQKNFFFFSRFMGFCLGRCNDAATPDGSLPRTALASKNRNSCLTCRICVCVCVSAGGMTDDCQ